MLLQHYVPLREYVTVLKDVLKSPSIASTVATKDAEGNETRLVEAKITQSYFIITCLKCSPKYNLILIIKYSMSTLSSQKEL